MALAREQRLMRALLDHAAAVEDDDRVAEIARMLGGDKPTARSLAHAREMLDTTAPRRKQA